MALSIFCSPLIFIHHQKPNPTKPSSKRVLMLAKRDHQQTTSSLIQIKSSIKIQKVFEDESNGVVCYIDDKGEITCEGYDEGPRILQQGFSRFSFYQRGAEAIVDLLQRSLVQAVDGAGKIK